MVVDVASGVYGHRVSMLDFSPVELERVSVASARSWASRTQPASRPPSPCPGSAAQSKVQTHPGDCDYFERVNIHAPTREDACRILGEVMRAKALATERGDGYRLIEVKFGSAPFDIIVDGDAARCGKRPDVASGAGGRRDASSACGPTARRQRSAGRTRRPIPGWCKLDWVVADPAHGTLANASNMLDVTWEAPDGTITPLDGHLDGYFQEVYLEADSIPIFSKVVRQASADALDEYVAQLEHEVAKYLTNDLNYGKAAKRMYNVFRLTGRYPEAAYIRELFDEPAAVLYQVWSMLRTLDDAMSASEPTTLGDAEAHADLLITEVTASLDGPEEAEIVEAIVNLRARLGEADHPPSSRPALRRHERR